MEKHALYHMTWKEIEEVFKNDPVVIIPMVLPNSREYIL